MGIPHFVSKFGQNKTTNGQSYRRWPYITVPIRIRNKSKISQLTVSGVTQTYFMAV